MVETTENNSLWRCCVSGHCLVASCGEGVSCSAMGFASGGAEDISVITLCALFSSPLAASPSLQVAVAVHINCTCRVIHAGERK